MSCTKILRLVPICVFWLHVLHQSNCVEFNRPTLGVVFSPYVKRSENNIVPSWKSYSIQDVKIMLEKVSTKFSIVVTTRVGAQNVPYTRESSYSKSDNVALTAEASALLNKEKRNASLTVFIGILQNDKSVQMQTEIQVALDAAEISNRIHPETSPAIVFTHPENGKDEDRTKQLLDLIRQVKADNRSTGLKIGSSQSCYDDINRGKLATTRKQIVNESDFIICEVFPTPEHRPSGAAAGFSTAGNDLVSFRYLIQKINPHIEVMGQTGWGSKGDNKWENIDNLKEYWEVVNKWSVENNLTVFMIEAFDTPWISEGKKLPEAAAHMGWWRLKKNADVGKLEGYVEKIYEPREKEMGSDDAATSPWVYVGVTLGIGVIVVFMGSIAMLFLRVNKLQDTITNEDVREFMYGQNTSSTPTGQDGQLVLEECLKFPYDKSFEISKEKLKIRKDVPLLGTGQFGCVYKAFYQNQTGNTEVALKMAKSDCPKTALKSLLSEIKILIYLGKHPNIVSIHGAYTAEITNGVVYVATELCTFGSLESFLRKTQTQESSSRYANGPVMVQMQGESVYVDQPTASYTDMVRWSHEIACGMEYLGTKHVVHADLATRNVLLSFDKTAKITDFGLSRRLYDYTNYVKQQQEPLPWRWMAIESLKRLEFSSKSDVWSYGVTLWEIFSMGDLPYPGLSWNLDFVESLVDGLRMKSPPHATPEIYRLMVDCWHSEPKHRLTFTHLKESTGALIGSKPIIPENSIYSNDIVISSKIDRVSFRYDQLL